VPKPRKAGVVDSYAAIKAAQHAATARGQLPPAESAPSAAGQPTDLKKFGAAISHTAVPVKQLIECYECGYKFQLHGKAATINCNKCRAMLDISDHTIERRWTGALKTTGAVRVSADGIVEAGSIVANDFILEGTVEAGLVRAMHKLELRPGARFSEHNLQAPDLLIAPGATIAFLEPAEYRNVEIAGTLRANLHASGIVAIRVGGCLEGEIHGAHLIVEDGGGLHGVLRIEPSALRQK
jgi:cytoskeletal protein CcmA (bactofilin family)